LLQSHSNTMTSALWRVAVAGLGCALVASATLTVGAEQGKTSKDGVYSAAQAKRGDTLYQEQCAGCHSADLSGGGAPALMGPDFFTGWDKQSLADLTSKIAMTMPASSPGSLSREQSTDLVALILQANKFPPGAMDLPSDEAALKTVMIAK
jgi:mono/diheme cytochrome c family protein